MRLSINGESSDVTVDPAESLLTLLRRLGYKGVKNGCEAGDCGSCAVLVDGRSVTSCNYPAAAVEGRAVVTVEGLAPDGGLNPLQAAFLDTGAVQCGFCTPGMLVTATELLASNPDPSDDEIKHALRGNLCRCTGYTKPVEAIRVAAARMRESADE